jgi:hypothetical protein
MPRETSHDAPESVLRVNQLGPRVEFVRSQTA